MLRRIIRITRKEMIQIRRDPAFVRMLIMAPLLQLVIYGYVVATEVRALPISVMDWSESAESRRLIDRFLASGYFVIERHARTLDEVTDALNTGNAMMGVVVPREYAELVRTGARAEIQLLVDGTNSNTATIALGYTGGIVAAESNSLLETNLERKGIRLVKAGIRQEERVWFNPALRPINYMVPGIMCMLLLEMLVPMTAFSLVKERERGTIEQLMVTPVRAAEVLIGKTLPYVITGLVDAVLILAVGTYWFRVPIAGNLGSLLVYSAAFSVVALGLGILIATVVQTQQQVALSAQVVLIPNVLLSGFMFPIESMPEAMQWFTRILPMRYFLTIVRGVMMKGLGFADLTPQLFALLVLGIVVFSISWFRFRRVFG